MIAKLDCPHTKVRMQVTSPVEQTHRIVACSKEPWTCEWIHKMPRNSVLYDIGANVGSYTLMAAALGHRVVAIDPSFANYARLCENLVLNDLTALVIPLCLALSDQGGTLLMPQELTPGYSGGAKRSIVPAMTIRDMQIMFGLPAPTHIKVDVDGAEMDVIRGAGALDVSWLVEMQTGNEQAVYSLLGQPTKLFDQRNGRKIPTMSMALFERTPVPA